MRATWKSVILNIIIIDQLPLDINKCLHNTIIQLDELKPTSQQPAIYAGLLRTYSEGHLYAFLQSRLLLPTDQQTKCIKEMNDNDFVSIQHTNTSCVHKTNGNNVYLTFVISSEIV